VREDGEKTENEDKKGDFTNNIEMRESEHSSKRSRGVSGDKYMPDEPEGEKQPKLTSTIVAPMSDKQKPDSHKGVDKSRNRKMFGMLVGTLNKFKTDINQKSDALLRREKLEKEVDQKVRHEQEALQSKITEDLKQEKEEATQKRDAVKQQLQEKETQLMTTKWSTHRGHLQHFEKTVATPCIYYKVVDKTDSTKKEVTESKEDHEDKRGRHDRYSRDSRSKSPDKTADSEPMQTEDR